MSFVKIILLKIFYSQALKHHSMICFHLFRFIFIFFFKILNLKQILHTSARVHTQTMLHLNTYKLRKLETKTENLVLRYFLPCLFCPNVSWSNVG